MSRVQHTPAALNALAIVPTAHTETLRWADADVNARLLPPVSSSADDNREDPTPAMVLATSVYIRHAHPESARHAANAIAALRLMLGARASVNAQTRSGSTVLHRALHCGAASSFVWALLDAGLFAIDAECHI